MTQLLARTKSLVYLWDSGGMPVLLGGSRGGLGEANETGVVGGPRVARWHLHRGLLSVTMAGCFSGCGLGAGLLSLGLAKRARNFAWALWGGALD